MACWLVLEARDVARPPVRKSAWLEQTYPQTLSNQTARADSATGFDITKYEISLSINDQTHLISGNVKTYITAEENLTSIQYELIGLTVSQVKVNNVVNTYTHSNGVITIPVNVSAGQMFNTEVTYSGIPIQSPAPYYIGMIFTTNSVFTISDPDASRYWWPCYDHPWDKAIVDLHITMRSDWKVAANGIRTAIVNNGNGTSTTSWIGENPMTTYLVCVTAAPFVEINQSSGDIPIHSFVLQNQYNNALVDFEPLPDMIDYFSEIFGPYPFEKYGQAVVAISTYGAMEHQTMTTLGNFIITGNGTYELIIAHELAHQWYGDCVSFLTFKDVWLSEGFATYSEQLWVDKVSGWQAACDYVSTSYHQYYINWENGAGPRVIYDPPFNSYFSPPSYEKAASVLHMLRLKVGETAFFNILQTYFSTYHNGNSSARTTSPTATQFEIELPIRINHSAGSDSLLIAAIPAGGSTTIINYPSVMDITSIQIDPNHWVLLRNIAEDIPTISECLPTNNAVFLSWPMFLGNEAMTYKIYRRISGTEDWICQTPHAISTLSWLDQNVVNNTTYEYTIRGMDVDGFESMLSNIMTATPVQFSFVNDLLVIDETRDGNGTAISPNDVMVDDFYGRVLSPIAYTSWDIQNQGAPSLDLFGTHKVVLWHDDDFSFQGIGDHLPVLSGYLYGGGKLVISGWKTPSAFSAVFLDRFCHEAELIYDNPAVLITATSNDYPDLYPDPGKLSPTWTGMLPMIYTWGAGTSDYDVLYQANMVAGSYGEGLPVGVKFSQAGELVVFGFPLYFMQEQGVRDMLQQLLPELEPSLPLDDETQIRKPVLLAYPNPGIDHLTFKIEQLQKPAQIGIYNLKGQLVRQLNVQKDGDLCWNASDETGRKVASGVYFIQLKSGNSVVNKKVLILSK